MAQYPKDQFDDLPRGIARVGAHRADIRTRRGWFWFGWAALACGVLVVSGVVALSIMNGTLPFGPSNAGSTGAPTATPTSQAEPVTDPTTIDDSLELTITVLNGTPVEGLQDTAGDILAGQQWPVGSRNVAVSSDVEQTTVYYNSAEFEGIARGVLAALGGVGAVELSDAYLGAPITVVLGADYAEAGAS
ncbi:LytR C-terminal domain-containing protein [Lysobacter korlensis]|uniref:LytR C-terminal domain-containing protein n=1 Tax=Lysobacter korlensis TaxID=553636 RepID=A0ABV6RWR8_9GAMM